MKRLGKSLRVSPGELEILLLEAALADGDEARDAWTEASRRIGTVPQLRGATYRLLPLLYRNLKRLDVEDQSLAQLKGVYRHAWYANHMLFRRTGEVIGVLEREGVDTLVLKGGALSRLYYDAPGTRPMEDIDLLVPRTRVMEAIEVLDREGWERSLKAPIESVLRTRSACEYVHPGGQKLDLHWSPFDQPVDAEPFWDAAVPFEINGVRSRALCSEDQLLHVCVHGVSFNMRTPYWVADAVMVVRARKGMVDWERVVERARAAQLTLALEYGLRFLNQNFNLGAPDAALERLRASPKTAAERLSLAMALTPQHPGVETVRSWDRYRRQAAREGTRATPGGFATYQCQWRALANRRELIGYIFGWSGREERELRRRLRARARAQ